MKKIISIALALVMVFAMGICALADEGETTPVTGSITITNANVGKEYDAYKIFDVELSDFAEGEKPESYVYTIKGNSEWYTVVNTYANAENDTDGLTLVAFQDGATYRVESTDAFNAADFAKYLLAQTSGKTATRLTYDATTNTAKAEGLELGYYLVTSNAGALADLTTTNKDVTIEEKNEVPFNKTADDVSVELGQKVNFTVTGKVPDTKGITTYTYKITDTMTPGLECNNDVVITISKEGKDDLVLTLNDDYTITYENDNSGYTLNIKVGNENIQEYVGGDITITYSANVANAAVTKVDVNTATLEYGHKDNKNTITKITKTYSAKIVIDKVDRDVTNKKLEGAQFVLYKVNEDDSKSYYNLTDGVVSWVDSIDDATVVTTDEAGAAEFVGLEDGTYYIKEKEAPEGYAVMEDDQQIVIADGEALNMTEADAAAKLTHNVQVKDAPRGAELPSTGGIGTKIFYIVGSLLVIGAAILLIARRRMGAQECEA